MRKHAMKIWEVSFTVDCQTKIVKCDYTAKKKNFEGKITVLPFSCILINKMHSKYPGTKNFGISSFGEYEWCKNNFCIALLSVLPTHRSCNGRALLFHHRKNQRNIRMVSVKV